MFVKHLEEYIYKEYLIYRTIIVTNNEKENMALKKDLKSKDYNAVIINEIENIDYNQIPHRIVIMTYEIFIDFINHLNTNNGEIFKSSYNLIAFTYSMLDSMRDELISFYLDKTNNNICETIFYDKYYFYHKYLNDVV
jgi:hypothetical protein